MNLFSRFYPPTCRGDRRVSSRLLPLLVLTLGPGLVFQATAATALPQPPLLVSQVVDDGVLQLEDTGDAVVLLQNRLTNLGFYDGPITGVFGPLTQDAVIKFQESNGLTADGVVGPATLSALTEGDTSTSSGQRDRVPVSEGGELLLGDAGNDVTLLQQRLTALGYYQGTVDGNFGAQTQAAVVAFQQSQGLAADGIVGPATLSALMDPAPAAVAAAATTTTPMATPTMTPTTPAAPATVMTPAPQQPVGTTDTLMLPPADLAASPNAPAVVVTNPSQAAIVTTPNGPNALVMPIQGMPAPDPDIMELQRQLTSRGYYSGAITGVLDDATQQAIAAAQRAYGLSVNDW